MSNTSDEPRELRDEEFDAVTGGLVMISIISGLIGNGGQSWGQAAKQGAVSGTVGGAAGL
jgi:hypothetical protein